MSLKKVNDLSYGNLDITLSPGLHEIYQPIAPYSCRILRILLASDVSLPESETDYFNILIRNNGFNGEKNIVISYGSNYIYATNKIIFEPFKFVELPVYFSLVGKGEILLTDILISSIGNINLGKLLVIFELEQI